MSVTLRPYRTGGWEADITIRLPDGSHYRERKRACRFSKSPVHRWAQDRERYLLQHGPPIARKEVPTLEGFAPRFVDGHARANRHKPSGIASTESILRWHLVPTLGSKRLEWRDIDLAARRLIVDRSDWLGHVTVPKGGRSRQLPMTQRLTAALKGARHLRSERVLCLPDGSPIRAIA